MILRNGGRRERRIKTINGELCINRSTLRVEQGIIDGDETIKELIPLDEQLKIDALPFKMTKLLMTEIAFWSQCKGSFKAVEKIVQKQYQVQVSDEQIRKVSYCVGKQVFEADKRRAEAAYAGRAVRTGPPNTEGVLYLLIDRETIGTREISLGIVFNSAGLRTRKNGVVYNIVEKEYVAHVGDRGEFKKHLLECALRNGYGRYTQTVVLSDGAPWIGVIANEVFPDAAQGTTRGGARNLAFYFKEHKKIVQKRCKKAGAMWDEAHLQYLLTLMVKEKSGLWDEAVRDPVLGK